MSKQSQRRRRAALARAERYVHARVSEREDETRDLSFREFSVRSTTIDEANRTIEAQIATENPVPMIDWERYEMIPEILRADGMVLPDGGQVPLLDNHQRSSTEDQLGSVRNIRNTPQGPLGTLHFSSTAEKQWTKVRERHITDVSAGYKVLEKTFVPKGTTQIVGGRSYSGPVNVATKWKLREVSVTPIGADELSKLRGAPPAHLPHSLPPTSAPPTSRGPQAQETLRMDPELRNDLISRGMPATLDDAAALRWMAENRARMLAPITPPAGNGSPSAGAPPAGDGRAAASPPAAVPAPAGSPAPAAAPGVDMRQLEELLGRMVGTAVGTAIDTRDQQRTAFVSEVRDLCDLADVPHLVERCTALYGTQGAMVAVRKLITDEKATRASAIPTAPVILRQEGRDKLRGALSTALQLRCFQHCNLATEVMERSLPTAQRTQGHEHFRYASLLHFAEKCLEMDGIDIRGLPSTQIAMIAIVGPERAGIQGVSSFRGDGAYHTTGSFPILTQDAMNKSMMVGYSEYPSTWRILFSKGLPAKDFKTIHRMQLGSVPNLAAWPTNSKPEQASFADAQETYAVEAYSLGLGMDWRVLVNDDMDVISKSPNQLGLAASRTVNAHAWSPITGNPTMGDGLPLFSTASGARKRSNRTSGTGVPSVATVQILRNQMLQMRTQNTPEGNEGTAIVGPRARFLWGPGALQTVIEQLTMSAVDPGAAIAGVYNNTRNLIPVIEPLLDAVSTTRWGLACSPSEMDTVEVTFLEGQETPFTRSWIDPETMSQNWAILQTFGVKALNHRGLQDHLGA